jgi:hypothetical protein
MAVTPTRLCATYVPTAVDTLYTVGTGTVTRIDAMVLTNTDTSAQTVSVYLVPSGGTPDNSNIVMAAQSIAPGETRRVSGAIGQVLRAGGTIRALASAATKVAIYASGVEIA